MPPKSTKSDAAPESAPRRSARISAAPPSASEKKGTDADAKKRTASDKPAAAPVSKKAKPASKADAKPASKKAPASRPKSSVKGRGKAAADDGKDESAKAKDDDIPEEKEDGDAVEKSAEEEKKAEAPKDATPEGEDEEGGKIKEGDALPDITLQDEEGKDVQVKDLAKDKGVVLFLYPKASTPGCTTQACGFRDAFDEVKKLGYDVYGLSTDKPSAQKNWKTKQNLQYKLLCDPSSVFIKRLGAFVPPKNTKRSHFIFEKGTGKLVEAAYGVKPAEDPKNCLKTIKSLAK